MLTQQVTVNLPLNLVQDMDREEADRSSFIQKAVRHELQRRRQRQLHRALENPHPESEEWAELGFDDWAAQLPTEDVSELVDPDAGIEIRWQAGEGWREVRG